MKLLHTADWHLCTRLGRIDRTQDLMARVQRVAEICDEQQVELLVIAGDLFSERATNEQMTEAFRHLKTCFDPFFSRGGIILAVTGNHDRDTKLDLMRSGMGLAMPRTGRELQPGRMYLFNQRGITRARDRAGNLIQFVLLPYPYPARYEINAQDYPSQAEQFRALREQVRNWMSDLQQQPERFDVTVPTVLVGHLHVQGSVVHELYQMNPGDDIEFEFADLNPQWQYIALGHIHKPQALSGMPHVRYSGSLDRLDFGEQETGQGVVLVELQPGQPVSPIEIPIPPTRFARHTLEEPVQDLVAWAEQIPNRDETITVIRIGRNPADRAATKATLEQYFPRLVRVEWPEEQELELSQQGIDAHAGTPRSIIRSYLESQIPLDDPEREDLFRLADDYAQQVEHQA